MMSDYSDYRSAAESFASTSGSPGKSGSHPSPNPLAPAPEHEDLSVCTSSFMPPSMQRNGAWRVDQFQLHKQVYEGRTSRLYLATDIQSGTPVALKLYRKRKLTPLNKIQVEREINIHVTLSHENIIKLYAAFEDTKNVYLVLEVAEAGDLFHQVKTSSGQQYSERKAVQEVIIPFMQAIVYLHEKGIIHRDIKPENILISSTGVLKLADFGLAIDLCEERPVTRLGTLDYMAPEVLLCPDKKTPEENKDRSDLIYSSQVDVWALGILTYEILSGHAPFERDSRLETYEHILKKEPEYPSNISEEAKRFIKATLVKDPNKRPSASSLMEHPWIRCHRRGSGSSSSSSRELASVSCWNVPEVVSVPTRLPDAPARHHPELRALTIPSPQPWTDLHVHIQGPQPPSTPPKHRLSCTTSPDQAPSSATQASASTHSSIFQAEPPAHQSSSSPQQPALASYNSFSASGPLGDQSPRKGQGVMTQLLHSSLDPCSPASAPSPALQPAGSTSPLPRLSRKPSQLSSSSLPSISTSFTKPQSGVLSSDESLIRMGDSMLSLGLAALLSPTSREPSQPNLASTHSSGHLSNPGTGPQGPQRMPLSTSSTPFAKGISSMGLGLAALLGSGARKAATTPVSRGGSLPSRPGPSHIEGWLSTDPRDKAVAGSLPKAPTRSFPARLFSRQDVSQGNGEGSDGCSDLHITILSDPSCSYPQKLFSPSSPQALKPLCLSPPASLGRPKSLRTKLHQEHVVLRTDSSPVMLR